MYDYHIHSNFSTDSNMTMDQACRQSIALGLKEIAFTDHLDIDYPNFDDQFMIDFSLYTEQYNAVRVKYAPRLKVIKGIEIGLQPHTLRQSLEIASSYEFDYIIASTHVVDKLDLHNGDFCRGKTKEQAYRRYLEDMYDCIKSFPIFNVLGHIDLIRRYGDYDDKSMKYGDYADILNVILKWLIENGKGIEINTSGFRYNLNSTMPTPEFVRRYKELGGEILTIGSDAHSIDYIAYNFDLAYDIAREAGFKYVTTFEQQQPSFKKI
ncbi:histidinol-phosphatase HisJ family protein [Mahella sp.]|uniref:histidinol-phosphatase HisJ family protein n=1 Tax=Mahella sp. TaxID=2798721 RepID=UPI0025BA9171|nr:histidinol-phosphatase HisJ family protein [Mahella sp.]MBZ4665092.1 histidinol phosphate phosphatase HisJ family [Mahella sp.]